MPSAACHPGGDPSDSVRVSPCAGRREPGWLRASEPLRRAKPWVPWVPWGHLGETVGTVGGGVGAVVKNVGPWGPWREEGGVLLPGREDREDR